MNEITFQIDLGGDLSRTTWIPGILCGNNLAKRHGDTFTLSGLQASYLKNLIEIGEIINLKVVTIPNVTDLSLSLDGQDLTVEWTANNSYLTEVVLVKDSWTAYIAAAGDNQMTIEVSPGNIQVRLRFTDGNGNYSKYYTTGEVTVESTGDFVPFNALIASTEKDTDTVDKWDSVYTVDGNEKLARYISDFRNESNVKMAMNPDDGYLYRFANVYNGESSTLQFQKVNLSTYFKIDIDLSGVTLTSSVDSLTYHQSGLFIISSSNNLYTVSTTGVVTLLNANGTPYYAMVVVAGVLACIYSNSLYLRNPVDGTAIVDETETPVSYTLEFADPEVGTIVDIYGLAAYNGESYVLLKRSIDETTNYYSVCSFNESTQLVVSRDFNQRFIQLDFRPVGEESHLLLLTDTSGFEDLIEGSLYDAIESPSFLVRFSNTEYQENIGLAWNQTDGYIYRIADRIFNEEYDYVPLTFTKIYNEITESVEPIEIELSGYTNHTGVLYYTNDGSYISDGLNDMYDSGNLLGTNLTTEAISYTHTKQSGTFSFIGDGSVNDGTTWFGSGSNYFTNLYPGLFVLVATGTSSISKFLVGGELGADGGGNVFATKFVVNISGSDYTVSFKKVFGAGSDPSVNHLIITNAPSNGLTHEISYDTNSDYDSLSGTFGTVVYYLLFGIMDAGEVSLDEAEAIATAFLNIVHSPSTAANKLTALNGSYTDVTDLITDMASFSDSTSDDIRSEMVGTINGIVGTQSMVYVGALPDSDNVYVDTFLVSGENGLFYITSAGQIRYFRSSVGVVYTGMAVLDDIIYATVDYYGYLVKIDLVTGDVLNEAEDEKFDTIITINGNLYESGIDGLTTLNGELVALIHWGDETHTEGQYLFYIDKDTGEATILDQTSDNYQSDITGVGVNPPRTNDWFGNDEDGKIRISIDDSLYAEFDSENVEVQWNPATYDPFSPKPTTGWESVSIDHMIETDGNYGYIVLDILASNITIRMRYPNSDWKYVYYD